MPLFGSTRRRPMAMGAGKVMPAGKVDQYDPTGEGLQRRRRGLFGGVTRMLAQNPDGDDTTPDFWQYLMLGPEARDILQQRSLRQGMFDRQVRQDKFAERDAEEQRAALEAARGALPENLRAIAPLLTPEAISRAVMPSEPEWEQIAPGQLPSGARFGQRNTRTGQTDLDWAPQASGGDGSRVQYRPVTPQEAQVYGLPGNGAGFVMGDNGRPIRVGGGGSFSPDQRARVEIGLEPAFEAVQTMDRLEISGGGGGTRASPRNREWVASIVDFMDGEGTSAAARTMGGEDFQTYTSAASAFESGMLPILSGAAVTDSEARRMIRAALPQLGDGPTVLAQKARRRQQMVNGAAIIGGREPPYPEAGVPTWASRAQQADGASAERPFSDMSDEELERIARGEQ